MKRFLVVVDMQNDFVDGALGTPEAQRIVEAVVRKINGFDGELIITLDTHNGDYLNSAEGKNLSVAHCIKDTKGWQLNPRIAEAICDRKCTIIEKPTFGAVNLPEVIEQAAGGCDFSVELVGLCTDICVVSNALLLKAHFYENEIAVDADCCAGVTPESHKAALTTMQMCQIVIKGQATA